MTEKEIRERIERFLKRTAEAVVVPATMGLGLAQGGCDNHSLAAGPADSGAQVQNSDTARNSDVPDPDLPYLLVMLPDAADLVSSPDVVDEAAVPDAGPDGTRDSGPDVQSEAGRSIDAGEEAPRRLDLGAEVPPVQPPYLAPPPPPPPPDPPAAPDARSDTPEARPDTADTGLDTAEPDALPPPPPPYMVPPPPPPMPSTSKK